MTRLMKSAVFAAAMALASPVLGEGVVHRVAVHIDQNDPQVMNMVLNNVANLHSYYASVGDTAVVEVVAYGPGLQMYVEGKSPVADRIAAMSLELPDVTFSACANTLDAMEAKAGAKVPLISEARMTPSGVVRLIELQEEGFAYVRP